jgi:ribosome recycling factor
MAKSIEALKGDLQKIRTGRAHTGLLDQVQVDYYGSMVPHQQVANVSLLDARTISVQPWEKRHGREDREGHPRLGPGPEPRPPRAT